ncbi:DinB family protein [Ornithinibacillus xuwenensis]|uniref:DinB family protein n=1 Tax=Ornithinibacillus xuwenensis TaxID=3144668 RepID=A0ABU9XGS8_9BACI
MKFNLNEAIEILERTPQSLENLLVGLSVVWLDANEGEGTWNPTEIIAHLIEAERFNWVPRLEFILQEGENNAFPAFDRFSHLNQSTERTIEKLLLDFKTIRSQNIMKLKEIIDPALDLDKTGFHPAFGVVKIKELIATWAVHDLTHISQIVRVMAKHYQSEVGPWQEYLGILK